LKHNEISLHFHPKLTQLSSLPLSVGVIFRKNDGEQQFNIPMGFKAEGDEIDRKVDRHLRILMLYEVFCKICIEQ
jgi:hypothetical protein